MNKVLTPHTIQFKILLLVEGCRHMLSVSLVLGSGIFSSDVIHMPLISIQLACMLKNSQQRHNIHTIRSNTELKWVKNMEIMKKYQCYRTAEVFKLIKMYVLYNVIQCDDSFLLSSVLEQFFHRKLVHLLVKKKLEKTRQLFQCNTSSKSYEIGLKSVPP